MKIHTALLVTALAATTPLAAQYDRDPRPEHREGGAMIRAGVSFGDVSNSGVLPGDVGRRDGAAIGIGFVSGGPLGIGVDAMYVQRGITGDIGSSRELDYIDVPIYLRLAASNPSVEPYVLAGPQISFELKCDDNGDDCPSGRDRTTYAGIIGAGLRFPAVAGISVEGRYVYGLSDLELGTVGDDESYRTRSFMLLFGLGF